MNKTDAAAILSIDPSASPEEARRAYQELFTEHQVRLTNAPTPALRSLYQARILELDEAKDAFLATGLADADSDLPTDQPSIPSQASAPPPPRASSERPAPAAPPSDAPAGSTRAPSTPPPPPADVKPARPVAPETKKNSPIVAVIGGLVVVGVIGFFAVKAMKSGDDETQPAKVAPIAVASYADSLPPLRENITVARVEFGRGDYDAANSALSEANRHYSALPPAAAADTAVIHLKLQVDSLHAKVVRACEALKKVAERHPGEPTCKSL